jgi:putative photosynthetic complex assembly protein 2
MKNDKVLQSIIMEVLDLARKRESTTLAPEINLVPRITLKTLTVASFYSILFWWLSTAIIIYFNFQPEHYAFVFWSWLALAAGASFLLYQHRNDETIQGAYWGFSCGCLIWGFMEVSFYTGYIVGPEVRPIFTVGPSMIGFFKAVHRSVYHEGLVIIMSIAFLIFSLRAKNKFGAYTFWLFWLMHQSAKLNIFLGVMNTGKEFVPESVSDMTQYMTIAQINWLFPISITICTIVAYRLIQLAMKKEEEWKRVGFMLTGVMAVLAWLEHWLLVLPLDQSLWDIMIKRMH